MTDFNIPAGTTQTISGLSANSTNTVEGNSTAAYGAGGGTLNITSPLPGHCSITGTGCILDVDGVANADTITLNNSTLVMTGGSWNSSTVVSFGTGASGVIVPSSDATSPNLGGVQFTGLNSGDYISTGSNAPITSVSWTPTGGGTLSFTQNGVNYAVAVALASGTSASFTTGTEDGHLVLVDGTVACFLAATLIRTAHGEVAIENLRAGDLVVANSGGQRPIKWIGRRAYPKSAVQQNRGLLTVCLRAGSLGFRVPERDLYVSQKHAMFIDGVLIHAIELVNGRSIVLVTEPTAIEYFHVELDRPAIIFAEGAPTESYTVWNDNRRIFQNVQDYVERYGADVADGEFCAPLIEWGPRADAARARLAGWAGLSLGDAKATQGRLLGSVDQVGPECVEGWAMDEQVRDVPLRLGFFEDGNLVASVLADRYRPDLAAAGIGFGRHGFRVAIPRSDRSVRRIDVRRADDGALLPGSHAAADPVAA